MRQTFLRSVVTILFIFFGCVSAYGQASCSAKNDEGGKCSIQCETGQAAECMDTTAANPPICKCTQQSTSLEEAVDFKAFITGDARISPVEGQDLSQAFGGMLSSTQRACKDFKLSGKKDTIIVINTCNDYYYFKGEGIQNNTRIQTRYRLSPRSEREILFRGKIFDIIEEKEINACIQLQSTPAECVAGKDASDKIKITRVDDFPVYHFKVRNSSFRHTNFVRFVVRNGSGTATATLMMSIPPRTSTGIYSTADPSERLDILSAHQDSR
ncbi:hypothetical protein [Roseovarius aestuariivivens]|uniref:hypothetical protein n=1 Tax=Roseovarius aestuariivivens TaxID=1888910 RepID=UPI0010803F58|nr:hypothetical protein [Roseovarius aestuariivivens]